MVLSNLNGILDNPLLKRQTRNFPTTSVDPKIIFFLKMGWGFFVEQGEKQVCKSARLEKPVDTVTQFVHTNLRSLIGMYTYTEPTFNIQV